MADAFDRRAERLARRVRLGIRLVFYPAALVLIVVAWQHYHGNSASGHTTKIAGWSGVTSQGERISAITGDARLVYLDTYLAERCADGSSVTFHWMPGEGRFVQHGATVQGRTLAVSRDQSGARVQYDNRLAVRLDGDRRGTVRAMLRYLDRPGGRWCDSGPVTFSLPRPVAPRRRIPSGAR
jgi:hypothetical protein